MINRRRQHVSRISLGTRPILVAAHFLPSHVRLSYHKFGLNLFAAVMREN
jgi:hypothetical protein